MNISMALRLLYYIIILLPALTIITYLGQGLYRLKQGNEKYSFVLIDFVKRMPIFLLYGVSILLTNKFAVGFNYEITSKIFVPIIFLLLSVLYSYIMVDDKNSFGNKLTIAIAYPCLLFIVSWIEKMFTAI